MSIQTKVTSYELSKALADAGIVGETEFYHVKFSHRLEDGVGLQDICTKKEVEENKSHWDKIGIIAIPAWLSCELLDILDYIKDENGLLSNVSLHKTTSGYLAQYLETEYYEADKQPQNALAKLILELNKQGLLGGGE